MTEHTAALPSPNLISAKSARAAAALFNWGNIFAILIPVPVGLLWLGASMIVYAMNRHHPNERVGHYTQQAAYRFYGITGFVVAIGAFFPGNNHMYYLATWIMTASIIVPWSAWDLRCIYRQTWLGTPIAATED